MPSPDKPPCVPKPISTTIYFTKPSKEFSQENVIKSLKSDEDGSYAIQLVQGEYSVFLEDGDDVVCTELNCPSECFCSLISIENGSEKTKNLNLNKATW